MLLALPVLLATTTAGIFSSTAPSADQRATQVMGRADGYVSTSDPAATDALARDLAQKVPGLELLPVTGNPAFPVWAKDRTVDVHYQDADWSQPVVQGKYRLIRGHFPSKPGEIAIGTALAEELRLGLGDSLPYRWAKESPAKIVGLVQNPLAHQGSDYLAAAGQLRAWPKTGADTTNVMPSDYGLLLSGAPEAVGSAQALITERQLLLETRSGIANGRSMVEREPGLLLAPGVIVLGVVASGAFTLRMRRIRSEFAHLSALGFSDKALRTSAMWGALQASLVAVPLGWVLGTAISAAARPTLPELTQRDISPYDPLLSDGLVTVLLSLLVSVLTAAFATRYPTGTPARARTRVTPRETARRRPTAAPVLAGLGALLLALASAILSGDLAAWSAVAGVAVLSAAVLTQAPRVLRLLAHLGDRSFSGRIALRAFARDPRRPVSAVAVGTVSIAVAVGVLGTLSSIAAQERATYVGSRHLGQVEALLYAGTPPQDVEEALSAALPKGTSIVRGTTVTDQQALTKANTPALAEGWSVAPRPGSGSEGRLQPIQIVNDAQTFEALTGRQWTDGERAALQNGRVLALSPDYLAGDRVTLAVPVGAEKYDTSRKAAGVLVEQAVDDTTRSRAVAYVSASAVRAWGGVPVDYSVIATTGDQAPPAELDGKLAKALEPVNILMSDVRIERGPEGPTPTLWYIMLALALAALAATLGIVVASSAAELRPDLVRLHRLGIAPRVIRRVVVWQSLAIAVLAVLLGVAAGTGLVAARVWPFGAPVVLDWTAVGSLVAATLVLGCFYGAIASPRRLGNALYRAET
ncbi:FtsX-like permease family protein [Streptomyces chilikensis]|uniref:FtsX-like permease family protein n=1 Tax=Streptomyces chilikensis TaxID=1194079 RepID=A0ABV3EY83_9ACTN